MITKPPGPVVLSLKGKARVALTNPHPSIGLAWVRLGSHSTSNLHRSEYFHPKSSTSKSVLTTLLEILNPVTPVSYGLESAGQG